MSLSDTALFHATLRLMAAAAAASLACGWWHGFRADPGMLSLVLSAVVVPVAIAGFCERRYGLVRLAWLLRATALFLGVPSLLVVMSYVLAAASFPLVDPALARIDGLAGFDWTAHLLAVWSKPWLGRLLETAYHATAVTLTATLAILLVLGRTRRIAELWFLMVAAGIFCMAVATLLPAEGAFLFHAPDRSLTPLAAPDNGIWHLSDFRAIRAGAMRTLDPGSMQGIVTFPSYHTAMALIFARALRGTPFALPAALLAGLVIVSTLAIGGHYLVDVAAGAAITAVLMLAVRERKPDVAVCAPVAPETRAVAA
jgi:membrane-associated phospholipid phosphatase